MNLECAAGSDAARSTDRSIPKLANGRHHLAARRLVLGLPVSPGGALEPEWCAESYHHLNRPGKTVPPRPGLSASLDVRRHHRRAAVQGQECGPGLRLAQHACGKGARYTRSRLPIRLVYTEKAKTRGAALSREAKLKQLTRKEKLALID